MGNWLRAVSNWLRAMAHIGQSLESLLCRIAQSQLFAMRHSAELWLRPMPHSAQSTHTRMPIQFVTFQLDTLLYKSTSWQLATLTICHHDNSILWQLATMTNLHSDNSPPWKLDTLTTHDPTTEHYDNSTQGQLVIITSRHHENLVTSSMETHCKIGIIPTFLCF
jgi:hypothetical protein